MRNLSTSMPPILFLPRFNAIVGAFRTERFAILSAFRPDSPLESNLQRQSMLVDAVKEAEFTWFPLVFDWCGEMRRSVFVHRRTTAEARQRSLHSQLAGPQMQEPTMEAVLRLRRRWSLGSFILGEKGAFLVYEGEPALPTGTGDKLQLNVDADFIAFHRSGTSGDGEPKNTGVGK